MDYVLGMYKALSSKPNTKKKIQKTCIWHNEEFILKRSDQIGCYERKEETTRGLAAQGLFKKAGGA